MNVDKCTIFVEKLAVTCIGSSHQVYDYNTKYIFYQADTILFVDIDPQLKCSNPSCFRPKWKEKNGRMYDFCGKSCRDAFNKQPVKPTGS